MLLETNLQKFGLNEKEAKVYLAVLQLGSGTVLEIAQKAELKRPTVYLVLDSLKNQGLTSRIKKGNKILFIAESPEKITDILKQKEKAFNNVLPLLQAYSNINKEKPQVTFYEGAEAVTNNVYKEIWNIKQETCFFGCMSDLAQSFPNMIDDFDTKLLQNRITNVKEIISNTEKDINRLKRFTKKSKLHEIRIAPKNIVFSSSDNIIFKDKIAIISVKKDIFAVVIESKDIANAYRKFFDIAWDLCIPAKRYLQDNKLI